MNRKNFLYAFLAAALVMGWFAYQKYAAYLMPNVPLELKEEFAHIPSNSSFEEIAELLHNQGFIKNKETFVEVSERLKYKREKMRSGRFKIEPGSNNYSLVKLLRNGEQAPVKLVLTNARLLEDIAAKVARFIEPDSAQIMQVFSDPGTLQKFGYTTETLPSLFIPNTYEFFWNCSPQDFMKRMQKEHKAFWGKNDRLAKAKEKNMTPEEVYTMASIVERETNQNSEKKRMAGVYMNRYKIGMRLQADPTCVFATRDFTARRVTNYHLEFKSPYNTYLNVGLPPGPISMASIPSIDAVLGHEDHKYIYFCAKPDGSGFHAFAKTLAQHNRNAAAYHRSIRNRR